MLITWEKNRNILLDDSIPPRIFDKNTKFDQWNIRDFAKEKKNSFSSYPSKIQSHSERKKKIQSHDQIKIPFQIIYIYIYIYE